MTTLNQIVKRIEEISDQHYFVKTFQSGDGSQIAELDQSGALIYPLAFLEDKPATSTGGAFYYNFDLIIVDLVQDDRSNEQEVKSDCLQSAIDFITTLSRLDIINESTDAYFYSEQSVTYSFVSEQFQDRVSGVRASISLKQGFEFNTCILPITGNVNCGTAFNCTDLINSLTATELNECILPNYDFSNVTVQGNVTAGQQTDLDAWLCTPCPPVPTASGIAYQRPIPTYDNVSYRTGDDVYFFDLGEQNPVIPTYPTHNAELDYNHATPFYNLITNNAFGNKDRYTNDVGGSVTDGSDGSTALYLIDHYTGLGWYTSLRINQTFNNHIDNALALTVGSYSDFFMPNRNQLLSVAYLGDSSNKVFKWLTGSTTTSQFSTSTTINNATSSIYIIDNDNSNVTGVAKTSTRSSIYCRNHYT